MEIRRKLVFFAFLIPIIAVAFVSISHVTSWYSVANPMKWATYLSVGIEVAALSALAGFSVNLGRLLYPPLILVTIIQFIGNVFYNFQFIDIESELFKDWVDLSSPLLYFMGIEETDVSSHKRILAVLEGGFLPAISLFFMHLLMKLQDMKIEQGHKETVKEMANNIEVLVDNNTEEKIENVGVEVVEQSEVNSEDIIIESEKPEQIEVSNQGELEDLNETEIFDSVINTDTQNVSQSEDTETQHDMVEEKKIKKLLYSK